MKEDSGKDEEGWWQVRKKIAARTIEDGERRRGERLEATKEMGQRKWGGKREQETRERNG